MKRGLIALLLLLNSYSARADVYVPIIMKENTAIVGFKDHSKGDLKNYGLSALCHHREKNFYMTFRADFGLKSRFYNKEGYYNIPMLDAERINRFIEVNRNELEKKIDFDLNNPDLKNVEHLIDMIQDYKINNVDPASFIKEEKISKESAKWDLSFNYAIFIKFSWPFSWNWAIK